MSKKTHFLKGRVCALRVTLFITCLNDVFFPGVGKDVVEILEDLGCVVDFPLEQTCCGQPAYNTGYHKDTKELAKHLINTFEHAEYIVAPSGSCVLMVHEYPELFDGPDDAMWKKKAQDLAARTFEFTQFLVDVLRVEDLGAEFPAKGTFHRSCHMTRLLGVVEPPSKLLSHVKGLEMVPLPHWYDCCGFGGTFSVKMAPISEQMVDEKIHHIESTGADVLIGGDCSCLMHIHGRMKRLGNDMEVLHIAQVLNRHRKR
jgi:L-lactate dehydrogenase complex protein LldE